MKPQVHREILAFTRLGMSPKAVAKITGVPEGAVAVIVRSPLAIAELARAS